MENIDISVLIKMSSLILDKYANQLLAPYDLTGSQFRILILLYQSPSGNIRQIDIENEFLMTNPTVTGLVQKLEQKGLIDRIMNPEDKRSKVLVLTERAMEMKEEILRLSAELEQQMTTGLSQKECTQLRDLLTKILNSN